MVKIEKIRLNTKRHVKYAVCSIYEKGDWTVFLDYGKMEFLPNEKMDLVPISWMFELSISSGRKKSYFLQREVKERKLFVYRLKKLNIEEKIKIFLI